MMLKRIFSFIGFIIQISSPQASTEKVLPLTGVEELNQHIFSYLSVDDLLRTRKVSHSTYQSSEAPVLWTRHFNKYLAHLFPESQRNVSLNRASFLELLKKEIQHQKKEIECWKERFDLIYGWPWTPYKYTGHINLTRDYDMNSALYALGDATLDSINRNLFSPILDDNLNSLSCFERFHEKDKALENLNQGIVQSVLFLAKDEIIDFHDSLTRLHKNFVSDLKEYWEKLLNKSDDPNNLKIKLSLSYCYLRFLPKDLFSIKNISHLNVSNNYLTSIPYTILQIADSLIDLDLGNYGETGLSCPCCDIIGCQIAGNSFKEVPEIVSQFKHLKELRIRSTGLKSINENLFNFFSSLEFVDISHNELKTAPKKSKALEIWSFGNPKKSWYDWGIADYRASIASITKFCTFPFKIAFVWGIKYPQISIPIVLLVFDEIILALKEKPHLPNY